MSDVQPIANFCWDTVGPVTPDLPTVEVTAFSVTAVDARTGTVGTSAIPTNYGVGGGGGGAGGNGGSAGGAGANGGIGGGAFVVLYY